MKDNELREWSDSQINKEQALIAAVAEKTREVVEQLLPRMRSDALSKHPVNKPLNPKKLTAEGVFMVNITFTEDPEVIVEAVSMPPVFRSEGHVSDIG
jgi:hypothetical protein